MLQPKLDETGFKILAVGGPYIRNVPIFFRAIWILAEQRVWVVPWYRAIWVLVSPTT
jgi:hypothetical protein